METSSNASNIDARQRAAGRSAFTKKELLSGGLPVDWHSFKPQAKSAHQTGTHHGGTYDDNLVEGRKAFPSPGSNLESHYLLGSQRLGRFRQRLQAVAHKRKARPDRRHIVLGPGVGSYRSRETYSNDVILVDGTGKIMSGATESETGDTNASSARPPQKITEYSGLTEESLIAHNASYTANSSLKGHEPDDRASSTEYSDFAGWLRERHERTAERRQGRLFAVYEDVDGSSPLNEEDGHGFLDEWSIDNDENAQALRVSADGYVDNSFPDGEAWRDF